MLSFVLLTAPGMFAMIAIGFALSLKVISDQVTRLLVLTMGSIAVCYESQWLYPVLMVASGLCTFVFDKIAEYRIRHARTNHRIPGGTATTESSASLPGPQFNFAAFLGVFVVPSQPFLGGLLGATAIFTPGILLKLGALPLYQKWKTNAPVRSILRGLNAGAIGLNYSAVYRLFRVGFVQASTLDPGVPATFQSLDQDGFWLSVVAATFVACGWFNIATPIGILGVALGGLAWYGVQRA